MLAHFDLDAITFALAVWPAFVDTAGKSVFVLAAVGAATLALRRSSAAVRHFLWMLGVIGVLSLPLVSALLPAWRVLPTWLGSDTAVAAASTIPSRESAPINNVRHSPGAVQSASLTPEIDITPPSIAQPTDRPPWRPVQWQVCALAVWGCGVTLMLLPIAFSLLSLRILDRRTPRCESVAGSRLLAECAGQLGIRHPITLLQGRREGMPMTWGLFATRLLIPAEALQWSVERQRVVLWHELAHVKRRDFLAQLVVRIARAIFWFNPLMWIAAKQIALESEGACDDLVIAQQTKASDYAEHLLAIASVVRGSSLFHSTAVAMARSSRFESRLRAILDPSRDRRAPSRLGFILGISLLAGGVLPLAMLRAAPLDLVAQTQRGPASSVKQVSAGQLAGTVTDEAGEPLAGVQVDVWTWFPGHETTTDQQGRFLLKNLDSEPIEIRFGKAGFSPWYNPAQPTGQLDLQVKLTNQTYVEGFVKDPDGKPLGDALIRADSGPKSNPGVEITSVWTETRSDQQGRYRLYVAPDQYVLQVRVPKVGAVRSPATLIRAGEKKTVDLNLARGVTFEAIAVDSQTGKPVPGVRLGHWQYTGIEGVSGNDGKISIAGISAGRFTFNVSAPGYARWWSPQATQPHQRKALRDKLQRNFDDLEFNVTDNVAPVTIELERAVRIAGVVHDPDGQPVAGATVAPAYTGTGNSITGDTRYSVPTSQDGKFVMTLPASGDARYNLVAHDGAYGQWRKWANGVLAPIQTKPGDEIKNVIVTLTRPATVRGHMNDETGKPLVGREVRASAVDKLENRYYDPTTKTDENGDFELRFIRPGEQFIQAAPFFWTNVPLGGMNYKFRAGETNSQQVTLRDSETKAGVQLTAPASTAFPSQEEQLRRILERAEVPEQ